MMKRTSLLMLIALTTYLHTYSQEASSLYYLCIGSSHYDFHTPDPDNLRFSTYEQLPEAKSSSAIMADLFEKYGKGKGIIVQSSAKEMISKEKILESLDKLWSLIEQEKKPNPLVVFYYSGHGFSDGLIGSQFLLSGKYPALAVKDDFEERLKKNLYILELDLLLLLKSPGKSFKEMDRAFTANDPAAAMSLITGLADVNAPRYQSVILLDCCRDSITSDALNVEKLRQRYSTTVINAIDSQFLMYARMVKQLVDNAFSMVYPILFSGEDMASVSSVKYPPNLLFERGYPYRGKDIAPICRETIITLDQTRKENETAMNLPSWLRKMIAFASKNEKYSLVTSFDLSTLAPYPVFQ